MRRTAVLLVLAGLLSGCGGADEPAPGATSGPASSAPAASGASTAPGSPGTANPGTATPGTGASSAPSRSPAEQAEMLDQVYDRLDARTRKQFCEQSDRVGPAALAEQVAERRGGNVDVQVLEDFLVDKCGRS